MVEVVVHAQYRPLAETEVVNFCNNNFRHLLLQNLGPNINNNNSYHHMAAVVNLQMSWGELWVDMLQWYIMGVCRALVPQIYPIFNNIPPHLEEVEALQPQIVIHCTILVNVLQTKNV